MEGLCFRPSLLGVSTPTVAVARAQQQSVHVNAVANRASRPTVEGPRGTVLPWRSYMLPRPLLRLWPTRREDEGENDGLVEEEQEEALVDDRKKGNWVMKILRIGAIWEGKKRDGGGDEVVDERLDDGDGCLGCCGGECCSVDDEEEEKEEEEEVELDRDSFTRLLRKVSLVEAKRYAQLSYLGILAYCIPHIKPEILRKHRLRLITSSFEKRKKSSDVEVDKSVSEVSKEMKRAEEAEKRNDPTKKTGISASTAYQIVASAASYLQSQTSSILPFRSSKKDVGSEPEKEGGCDCESKGDRAVMSEEASFVVTTNSVTAVVAAKDEEKEAVAKDLNSSQTSPCGWYICDDDISGTRYFIIQGSESLASWQTNLLFEPIQFEGLNVPVHRGIYEAAKGIYEQLLPEVEAHLESRGKFGTLRFTGHSLGGSLAVLVNLMLLIRGKAPLASLLPVITFGAPTIMCGGNRLLKQLGLPLDHVQAVTMHRDIVPRAFSCNYPHHVAKILKAVNRNFRNHTCLEQQKMLYEPMGELLILQPDENFSPHHHLLPSGSGLYAVVHSLQESSASEKFLRMAKSAFLNSPHPLEILSDRSAYGSEGTVTRDHDMRSYFNSIRHVIGLELKRIRKNKIEQRRKAKDAAIILGWRSRVMGVSLHRVDLSSIYHVGMESVKQFQKVVVSRNGQLLLMLLIPFRILVLKAMAVLTFG